MFYRSRPLAEERCLDGEFLHYTTVDNMPDEQEALRILRRCVHIVSLIMQRRGWKVPFLSEMAPNEKAVGANLEFSDSDGIRSNHTIYLVLRDSFEAMKSRGMRSIMQTLIHELAHMEHDFHLLNFHLEEIALLKELVRDYESGALAAVPSFDILTTTGSADGCGWWENFQEDFPKWMKESACYWVVRILDAILPAQERRDWPRIESVSRRRSWP